MPRLATNVEGVTVSRGFARLFYSCDMEGGIRFDALHALTLTLQTL